MYSIPQALALQAIQRLRHHPHVRSAFMLGVCQDRHGLVFFTFDDKRIEVRSVDEMLCDRICIQSCRFYVC